MTESPAYSTDTSLEVKDGDTVNIDYVGKIDDVAFDGGSTDGNGTDLVSVPVHTLITSKSS